MISNTITRFVPALLLIMFVLSCRSGGPDKGLIPPAAKKQTKTFSEHGNTRTDDYFWLNNPTDSTVIDHLKKENEYTEAMMKHTEKLQKTLYEEMISRIDQKYESLPVMENGYWYYGRYLEGKQYPLICRKKGSLDAKEEIILDIPDLAKGKQIYMLMGRKVTMDNNWLAYMADTSGDRRGILAIRNLNTGQMSSETISNTADIAWANDTKTLYYIVNDHTVRPYKLMKHELGANPATDTELYTEKDSTFSISLSKSKDKRYIFLSSTSTTTSECRYLDANNPGAPLVMIQPRQKDLLYSVDAYEGNIFHILTNRDAKNFKLVTAPIASPALQNWKDLIPHKDSALLENVEVLRNFIVSQFRSKGLTEIHVTDRKTNSTHRVDFGEDAYVAYMSTATDAYDSDSIRYNYQSLTTPATDYKYDLATKQKTKLKQVKVGGGYDQSKYETKRLWAKATDGTMIPISVVYKKNSMKKDGSNPLLLYAYGSYGYSTDPEFYSPVISLLDRDFVFAIAHVRGGQEMGRQWYEDGKLLKKKNTFTDFIDCGQFLVNEKYTSADKLFAEGGSAGGMLMGAITNMRPELFRGIIAHVPWMDVITDMYNPDLPLTTLEYDEWGDPRNKEVYDYMLSWSPYDNVTKKNYPSIFATAGLNDTQVSYFSPAKWVQKVRENNTGNNPVLFKVNMGAGHSGESGRFESQKLTAQVYAFMIDQLR
ncbi:MAG TPA: S9 family peptidase [Chitinophagaceae bacterium]|nr:S9 family peptidase [Chitinophagaceae bacterium]